jgi:hypothetical protein
MKEVALFSHLNPNQGAISLNNRSTPSSKSGNNVSKGMTDFIKDELALQTGAAIKYLVLMRNVCYICETEHIDRYGLRIQKTYYVDSECRGMQDLLQTK